MAKPYPFQAPAPVDWEPQNAGDFAIPKTPFGSTIFQVSGGLLEHHFPRKIMGKYEQDEQQIWRTGSLGSKILGAFMFYLDVFFWWFDLICAHKDWWIVPSQLSLFCASSSKDQHCHDVFLGTHFLGANSQRSPAATYIYIYRKDLVGSPLYNVLPTLRSVAQRLCLRICKGKILLWLLL